MRSRRPRTCSRWSSGFTTNGRAVKPSTGVANAKEFLFRRAGLRLQGRHRRQQRRRALRHRAALARLRSGVLADAPTPRGRCAAGGPDEPGTEIILEVTANGVGNVFHKMWRDAEAGAGDYIAIFVPWFWQDEYRQAAAGGLHARRRGARIRRALWPDAEQMAWRRSKIAELNDPTLFKQEYPATAGRGIPDERA